MCLYPISIRNKKYLPNKKNNGKPEWCEDERKRWIPVGCGRCAECRKQRGNSWKVRMMEEIKEKKEKYFVTLTFAEDSYNKIREYMQSKKMHTIPGCLGELKDSIEENEYVNKVATVAMRLFLENIRKKTHKSVRHFVITERGEQKGRIHLHGIWMGKPELLREWKYGRVSIGMYELERYLKERKGNFVTEKSINYIMKYLSKTNQKYKMHIGKVLCSKGIGVNAIEKLKRYKTEEPIYRDKAGRRHAMPKYYKAKLYSEKEQEKMWERQLDGDAIWINGEKIEKLSTVKGYELYEKALKYNRMKANQIGKIQKREKKSFSLIKIKT